MRTPNAPGPRRAASRLAPVLALAILLPQLVGCGREFYREWANQDVSEVVFEKSRDPRFRIDLFSIEPPWMSRYANPYDRDRPPSPPDDLAAQALSPVPQSPNNRLFVPVEGAGYLAMLEQFQVDHPAPPPASPPAPLPGEEPNAVPPALSPSPFLPGLAPAPPLPVPNSGTGPGVLSPPLVPGATTTPPPPTPAPTVPAGPRPAPAGPGGPQAARARAKVNGDEGVRRVAHQDPAPRPQPTPAPAPARPGSIDERFRDNPNDPLRTPRPPGDTGPGEVQDLSRPVQRPRPDLDPQQNAAVEAETAALLGLLGTGRIDFNDAENVGLSRDRRPYVVSMAQAFELALINARIYQYQLEQLYLAALPVTLNRFAFAPQFFAGLTPNPVLVTPGAANSPSLSTPINPVNSFTYRTRATGLQQSTLNIGALAGVGKNFDNGVKILGAFASQVIFNFVGKNPSQPTVQSYLPLSVVAPLLRGGGRAITLEPLTLAERQMLYQVRLFAKFRQEFTVATLAGGAFQTFGQTNQTLGFSVGGNVDPATGFLNVVEDFQLAENSARQVAAFEQFARVYKELIKGENSGLTQLQLDQLDAQLQNSRLGLITNQTTLRNDTDSFKIQLGLPPDTPLMVDRRLTAPFKRVFEEIERWARDPRRELSQLDTIASKLPTLEDVTIDGRSSIDTFNATRIDPATGARLNSVDPLEDLLIAAERVSLENRLDLMNSRAQLYDFWRQIKVSANALKGVLNVQVTNQFLTPPTTTNPFAFLSQAKQFSLVLNAELPLVRVAERNAFMTAIINYERQRRTLMAQEDYQKNQLRADVRTLLTNWNQFQIARRNLVLFARQRDQAFENIVAPPAGGATNTAAGNASGATQTNNLISAQQALINTQNQLVTTWYNYQSNRLVLYRDLGTLPYDEWEAFYEIFPSEYVGTGAGGSGTYPAGDVPAVKPPGSPPVFGSAAPESFKQEGSAYRP